MSRTFTIKELNEKIDALIAQNEEGDNLDGGINREVFDRVRIVLEDLKMELNEPEAIVSPDWVGKIQESLNIIETKKIIKDGL